MSVRFGLGPFTAQIPRGSARTAIREYSDSVALARLAEETGFHSAWVSEHHGAGDGYLPSSLHMLAAFAGATDRLLLGTGVLLAPFQPAAQLAREAETVQGVSGGRLVLGLGLGWRDEEFRMFGISPRRRLALTLAALEHVKQLPVPVPVYLGGLLEPAVRRAGRLADGYVRSLVGVGIQTGLLAGREAVAWFDAGAREAGRDPSMLPVVLFQNCWLGNWLEVRDGVLHQLGVYRGWYAGTDAPGRPLLVLPPSEAEALAQTPTGTPAQVAAALAPLITEFGWSRELHLVVRLHYPGMTFEQAALAVRRFASEVIPALS